MEMRRQLDTLLSAGLNRPSTSPFAAPVLFVEKSDGSFRMCIDYRALNRITIKNEYPLPRIDDLLDALNGAKFFSKIDLRLAYHQVRGEKQDIPKTSFRTQYSHDEYKVMPFGPTIAPAILQRTMNGIFHHQLNTSVLVYLDDILVYSKTAAEHLRHLEEVFKILRHNQFYAHPAKCQFWQSSVPFVGHVISHKGLEVQDSKVSVIRDWPAPANRKQLRSFLGLANYYRKFVQRFAELANPLTQLTSPQQPYVWTELHQRAFDSLKRELTSTSFLQLPHYDLPFVIHMDFDEMKISMGKVDKASILREEESIPSRIFCIFNAHQ